jgi:hypothetical protein
MPRIGMDDEINYLYGSGRRPPHMNGGVWGPTRAEEALRRQSVLRQDSPPATLPKLPDLRRLPCGCYRTCTCRPLLPDPIPSYEAPKLPDFNRLSCGCYRTCTCRPLLPDPIPSYEPPGFSKKCTCVGLCYCGNRY